MQQKQKIYIKKIEKDNKLYDKLYITHNDTKECSQFLFYLSKVPNKYRGKNQSIPKSQ
jgi:putative alpha-1,2-mannosidase